MRVYVSCASLHTPYLRYPDKILLPSFLLFFYALLQCYVSTYAHAIAVFVLLTA